MITADFEAYDACSNAVTHQYIQQKMNHMQPYYYYEPVTNDGNVPDGHVNFYSNEFNYADVRHQQQPPDIPTSTYTQYRYDSYPSRMSVYSSNHKDDAPTLRALLTKQNKQQDCNSYHRQEEHTESSSDCSKMLLSPSMESSSSETDRESETTKARLQQPEAQFYPWMKTLHGKSNQLL